MSTLIIELLSSVENLKDRLSNRHAEKLIPPVELKSLQTLWNSASIQEKCEILKNLNSDQFESDQIKRLFQLLSRQNNGIKTLISIREATVKEKLKGKASGLLTDVIQNNLDSSLDINRVTLSSDPEILSKLMSADRVHRVQNDFQFSRRFEIDRRVFVFNHKQNKLQPLMLLNIGLTKGIASSINHILDSEEVCHDYDSAMFYSISSLETGLRGIDLGHRLIVSSCDAMKNDHVTKNLKQFSSLSPVPNFRRWVEQNLESSIITSIVSRDKHDSFVELVKTGSPSLLDLFKPEVELLCCYYLTRVKKPDKSIECAVGNFHVRNGATLWRINVGANRYDYGFRESLSVMINYRYNLDDMWSNAHNYQIDRTIDVGPLVHDCLDKLSV